MSIKGQRGEKPCHWVGSSREDLLSFPPKVIREIGYALSFAQNGTSSASAKLMKGLGSGVVEIVEDFDGNTYRCVYLLRLKGAVYVLHAFQKKSKTGIETPKKEIDLIKSRIRLAEAHHKESEGHV